MIGWARPGVKVICISYVKELTIDYCQHEILPEINEIYTVHDCGYDNDGPYFRLIEIINKANWYANGQADDLFEECGFLIYHFRPLAEIEQFRSLVAEATNPTRVTHKILVSQ